LLDFISGDCSERDSHAAAVTFLAIFASYIPRKFQLQDYSGERECVTRKRVDCREMDLRNLRKMHKKKLKASIS